MASWPRHGRPGGALPYFLPSRADLLGEEDVIPRWLHWAQQNSSPYKNQDVKRYHPSHHGRPTQNCKEAAKGSQFGQTCTVTVTRTLLMRSLPATFVHFLSSLGYLVQPMSTKPPMSTRFIDHANALSDEVRRFGWSSRGAPTTELAAEWK